MKCQNRTINGRVIPKNAQNLKNDRISEARSTAEYDHVFWLKVDSEPAARDLFARRFSAQSDNIAFSGFFKKLEFYDVEKPVFAHFLANRLTDFQNNFFA